MGRCLYTWEEWDSKKIESIGKRCPRNTWGDSDEFCIFHDPSPHKDVDLFKEKLEEQMQSETEYHNFIGYYFPENWDFSGKEFEIDVDFKRATFHDADFKRATFQDRAYFSGATFQGNTTFSEATFQDADFKRATFHDADFWAATFHDATFWGATFQDYATFWEATFQDADFRKATFQDADFWEATFQDADFRKATFQDATFRETTFQSYANFRDATFKNANFWKATFQDANFWKATFQDYAYFRNATFKNANFRKATFQDADFWEAIFYDYATFSGAFFHFTIFSGAIFKNANFSGATFQDAIFKDAVFQDADFSRVTFQGYANFRLSKFKNAKFFSVIFHQKAELILENIKKLDLSHAEFFFRCYITANLSKTLFHRSFIENIAFIDCEWPDDYRIYEETHMKDEDIGLTYSQLETIYRDLKQNMQNHGDYTRAGKFYYREMEMRKKAMREKRFSLDWFKSFGYSLLKYTSGYGEKPERTAFSSLFTILIFAVLYFVFDCLKYSVENPSLYQQIKDSVYFSFVTFTTLGLGDIHPVRDWGKALICIEAVIGAFLIALFVVVFVRKMAR